VVIRIACVLLFGLLFGCRQSNVPYESNSSASELKIVASFLASESLWLNWKCTITGDGKVVKEVFDEHDAQWKKTETKLSQEDLVEIMVKVKEAEFDGLRDHYLSGGSDIARLSVAITENKKTKRVSVDDPSLPGRNTDVTRFLRVWCEILRKVPSPNADETPELYEPAPANAGQPAVDAKANSK
jgi:hypothetical protein